MFILRVCVLALISLIIATGATATDAGADAGATAGTGTTATDAAAAAGAGTGVVGDVVLRPVSGKEGPEIGFVFMQGAQINTTQYIETFEAIQAAVPFPMYVGIPEFPLEVAVWDMSQCTNRILGKMRAAGMTTNRLFFGGHSLGGAMLPKFLFANHTDAVGAVLMGAFLPRTYSPPKVKYPVPTLTIGGEVDGLCRITRLAEGYYHYHTQATNAFNASRDFPIVKIDGMSHMQFASGPPPLLVKLEDLKPEITYEAAHAAVAHYVSVFIQIRMGNLGLVPTMESYVREAGTFFQPMIDAMILESSFHIETPCFQTNNTHPCQWGNRWVEQMMPFMGGLTNISYHVEDGMHPVYQIPFHLPNITSNCTAPGPGCTLDINTDSQPTYNDLDAEDTGFVFISATEIRAKLKSRQSVYVHAGLNETSQADFNKIDMSSPLCASLNQRSVDWAKAHAPARTLTRFASLGQPMVMGPDIPTFGDIGPLWIWNTLHFNNTKDASGRETLTVSSPAEATPVKFFLEIAAGYHYCKLLSPARALEWMLVDGLKYYDGLSSGLQLLERTALSAEARRLHAAAPRV